MLKEVKTYETIFEEEKGIFLLSDEILKTNKFKNNWIFKYRLALWIEHQNSNCIENHVIKPKKIIKLPKERTDLLIIITAHLNFNEKIEKKKFKINYLIKFEPIELYQSPKLPGLKDDKKSPADDMIENDETDSEILKHNKLFKETIEEGNIDISYLFGDMKLLFGFCTIFSIKMKKEMDKIFKQFKADENYLTFSDLFSLNVYHSNDLDEIFKNTNEAKEFVNKIKYYLYTKFREKKYDIMEIKKDEFYAYVQSLMYPKFGWKYLCSGLAISIHDIHGCTIRILDARLENNWFSCKIEFNFYDHFGLDKNDIEKKFGYLAGFRAWYYLQHAKKYGGKYKPFITHVIFYEDFKVRIK